MSQISLEDICLSFCRDTALEILALRQQVGGFLPCLTTKILRIYSSRFNWYINRNCAENAFRTCYMIPHFSVKVKQRRKAPLCGVREALYMSELNESCNGFENQHDILMIGRT